MHFQWRFALTISVNKRNFCFDPVHRVFLERAVTFNVGRVFEQYCAQGGITLLDGVLEVEGRISFFGADFADFLGKAVIA